MNQPTDRTVQNQHYYDDEISLVDLAKTLIKRRWWLFGTSAVVIALAFVFALINRTQPAYNYTSIYQVAEVGSGEIVESIGGVIEKVNILYWPNYRRDYMSKHSLEHISELPFNLEVTNPKNTNLIVLNSIALEENESYTHEMHKKIIDKITTMQKTLVEREG